MTRWLVYTLVILQAGLALESLATIGTLQLLRAEIINLRSPLWQCDLIFIAVKNYVPDTSNQFVQLFALTSCE